LNEEDSWREAVSFSSSLDRTEPIHVHVDKGETYAKYWLRPVALALPVTVDPLAVDVSFTIHQLRVVLADGREILVPLLWVSPPAKGNR
jgi:hypothetical protein